MPCASLIERNGIIITIECHIDPFVRFTEHVRTHFHEIWGVIRGFHQMRVGPIEHGESHIHGNGCYNPIIIIERTFFQLELLQMHNNQNISSRIKTENAFTTRSMKYLRCGGSFERSLAIKTQWLMQIPQKMCRTQIRTFFSSILYISHTFWFSSIDAIAGWIDNKRWAVNDINQKRNQNCCEFHLTIPKYWMYTQWKMSQCNLITMNALKICKTSTG